MQSLITAEGDSRKDLALAFYALGLLSAGKAAEMAEASRMVFEGWLAERRLARPGSVAELERDLAWAERYG